MSSSNGPVRFSEDATYSIHGENWVRDSQHPNQKWHNHIATMAKTASKGLGFLLRAKHYLSPSHLHVAIQNPLLFVPLLSAVHMSVKTSPFSLSILDFFGLCLFYRYSHGRCSAEISSLVPRLRSPLVQRDQATTLFCQICRQS